jgi:subtilisin family serine protease
MFALTAAVAGAQETIQYLPPSDELWALDRIDQRVFPLDRAYDFTTFVTTVNIYVVDSGITGSHVELEDRTSTVYSYYADRYADEMNNDCNGHGTTVAGVIAGETYGAAKGAQIKLVRITGCNTGQTTVTASALVAALRWLRTNAVKPAVVNIALGILQNDDVDRAVRDLVASGVTVVVSAGNNYRADVSSKSPARVAEAITVAASNQSDRLTPETNVGAGVDLFAPGDWIKTTGRCPEYECENDDPTNVTGGVDCLPPPPCYTTAVLNGTSYAAAFVTGVVAQILQKNPTWTPAQVRDELILRASNVIVDAPAGTTNLLVRIADPISGPTGPRY